MPNLINTMMELRKCCNHPYLITGERTHTQIGQFKVVAPNLVINSLKPKPIFQFNLMLTVTIKFYDHLEGPREAGMSLKYWYTNSAVTDINIYILTWT